MIDALSLAVDLMNLRRFWLDCVTEACPGHGCMMEKHKNAQRKLFVLVRNGLFLPTKSYNKCKRHPFFFFTTHFGFGCK